MHQIPSIQDAKKLTEKQPQIQISMWTYMFAGCNVQDIYDEMS